jgi:hypothetical protein
MGHSGLDEHCTEALLNIEALGSECCGKNAWKSHSDLRYFPHKGYNWTHDSLFSKALVSEPTVLMIQLLHVPGFAVLVGHVIHSLLMFSVLQLICQ